MIIGISAPARSGKTTFATMLSDITGYQQYALAEPIKVMMNALFGWDIRHSEGHLKEEVIDFLITKQSILDCKVEWNRYGLDKIKGHFFRELVDIIECLELEDMEININTMDEEVMTGKTSPRNVYQKFGTEYGRKLVDPDIWLKLCPEDCILSDVRFENEAEFVREKGKLVFIERSDVPVIKNSTHESEKGVKRVYNDVVIFNNGPLTELESKANFLIESFK